MKVAVVYNSLEGRILQHRGPAAKEIYPRENIDRVVKALEQNGHDVAVVDADRFLVDGLEHFFGTVRDGEWPGLVFNLSFGRQGQLRYCHVPGIMEMLGLPYLGSGPLGHALASDKAVAKAIFLNHGLATPDFVLVHSGDFQAPSFDYPMVVKPMAEASSLGLALVENERELREVVRTDLATFRSPVMIERFVAGREINVSVLGNRVPEVLPPVEVVLGAGGVPVYSLEDKAGQSARGFELICPAPVPETLELALKHIAIEAFKALSCRDWARVELKLDAENQVQLIEVNTLPGLGSIASLPAAAREAGLPDLPALVQRLVDIAVKRYQDEAT